MKCSQCGKINGPEAVSCSVCHHGLAEEPARTRTQPSNILPSTNANEISDLTTTGPTLEALWKAAYGDIYPIPPRAVAQPIEGGPTQIAKEEKEALDKLWEAAQVIVNRASADHDLENNQGIDTASLQKTLLTVEREMLSHSKSRAGKFILPVRATRKDRLKAGLMDICYIALLAIVTTFSLIWFISPELRLGLAQPSALASGERGFILALFSAVALLFSYLYPIVAKCQTIGQKALGLALRDSSGGIPTQGRIALRGLLLPMSAISWIFLPPFWGDLGFHNQLTHTVVVKIPDDSTVP